VRRIALILLVNLTLLAVIVAGLEILAARYVDTPTSHLVASWRLNHIYKPNWSWLRTDWVSANPDFPKPFRHFYNEQSWIEDYDVERAKPAGTYRIFYVGDSFTEGTVPMSQSVPSVVERGLNDLARETDLRFEVINAGTASYSPLLYYLAIRYKILEYDPDLIVLNVDMTDDFDDWKYRETAIFDADGNPWAVPPRSLLAAPFIDTRKGAVRADARVRLQVWLYANSHLYNLILQRLPSRRAPSPQAAAPADDRLYDRFAWCQDEWSEQTRENVERMVDVLRRIALLCEARGVKLLLSSVPHHQQYAGNEDGSGVPAWSNRPHQEIASLGRASGVPYLDALASLASAIQGTPKGRYYYTNDMHFNPRGYQIWAAAHLAFLRDPANGLLPEASY
jgi:hypothetical protein